MSAKTLITKLLKRKASYSPLSRELYQSESRKNGTLQMVKLLIHNISPSAQTVLDIGCNEGVFARALAERGYFVTGIEGQLRYAKPAVAYRDSNRTQRLSIHNKIISPADTTSLASVDIILLLSVHHQWVAVYGLATANAMLVELASKARQQFFFSPACIKAKYGEAFDEFEDNDYQAVETYFKSHLEGLGGRTLRFLGTVENELPPSEPLRPLFILEEPKREATKITMTSPPSKPWLSKSDIFDVNLDICRIGIIQSPHANGWCYLTACVQEAISFPNLRPEQSILAKYYNKWRPTNWGEVLFPENPLKCTGLSRIPTRVYKPPLPWVESFRLSGTDNGEFLVTCDPIPEHEFHAHGPMKTTALHKEHVRLMNLLSTLSTEGYNPELNHDGYIRGYFLMFEGQERFLITGGQHRAGILGALQHDTIRVKFEPTCQRLYDFSEADKWPAVLGGMYSMQESRAIIERIFAETGLYIKDKISQ